MVPFLPKKGEEGLHFINLEERLHAADDHRFGDRVGRELLVEDGVGDVLGRSLGKGRVLADAGVQVLLAAAFEIAGG